MTTSSRNRSWEHLMQFGYAPGNYMGKCRICHELVFDLDKRAVCCKNCAEKAYDKMIAEQNGQEPST